MGAELGATTKSDPNVVPLCDILLVLLIIFMVITPVAQKGIDIKLPETSTGERGPQAQSLVLVVESDLSMTLNREPITKEMLETRLRDLYRTDSKKPLFVKADETVSYKEVLNLIDIAKGAGVDVVGVYTDRYQSGQ